MSSKKPAGTSAEAAADPAADAPAKKTGKRRIIILALLLLVVAGGAAGGTWYMAKQDKSGDTVHAAKPKSRPLPKPVFAAMDVFTVNLQDGRGERYAQVGVTLQLADDAADTTVKDHLPAIRNEILLLLASKHVEELLSDAGKRQLAQEIRTRVGKSLGFETAALPVVQAAPPQAGASAAVNPVQDVLFSQFIVQ